MVNLPLGVGLGLSMALTGYDPIFDRSLSAEERTVIGAISALPILGALASKAFEAWRGADIAIRAERAAEGARALRGGRAIRGAEEALGAEGAVARGAEAAGVKAAGVKAAGVERVAGEAGAPGRTLSGTRPLRGGAGPVLQGQRGVEEAARRLESEGWEVIGREVTLDSRGYRTRIDLLVRRGTEVKFVEVKTGPTAGLNPNQEAAFPLIAKGGAVPRGANAALAGLKPDMALPGIRVEVMHINWPIL